MNGYLRQSTASQTRTIGPFIDSTDFSSVENGLTIANTDILLKKNGGASAAKNSGGATADGANGLYAVTWDATDTNTVGELYWSVLESGALIAWGTYTVLEEAVYDAMFAASAPGYLQPTTAGRTLDVTATGAAGIDWGNVENPTTAVNLSATNIDTDQVVASVSGAVGSVVGLTAADVGAIKVKTDFLPSATAGSAGGLVIVGVNSAATSFTAGLTISNASGDALVCTSSGGNGDGIKASGNGSGNGLELIGGATGDGMQATGGLSGNGIELTGGASAGMGLKSAANAAGYSGMAVQGNGSGAGLWCNGGVTGDDITGDITGSLSGSVGSVTAGVTVTTNNDKTDYALSSAGNNAVADASWVRDLSAISRPGGGVRYPLQAIDAARNKVDTSVSPAVVYQDDDTTTSFELTLTTSPSAELVVEQEPV